MSMSVGSLIVALMLMPAGSSIGSVGFQQLTVPDSEGQPLTVGIWYPSDGEASSQPVGLFMQEVAANGNVSGTRLPLILISHGTAGSLASHYDTALALAHAGFVAAAVTHTGDNNADQSYAGNRKDLIDRPRQMKRVTDYMRSRSADLPGCARLRQAVLSSDVQSRCGRLLPEKPEQPVRTLTKARDSSNREHAHGLLLNRLFDSSLPLS